MSPLTHWSNVLLMQCTFSDAHLAKHMIYIVWMYWLISCFTWQCTFLTNHNKVVVVLEPGMAVSEQQMLMSDYSKEESMNNITWSVQENPEVILVLFFFFVIRLGFHAKSPMSLGSARQCEWMKNLKLHFQLFTQHKAHSEHRPHTKSC